MTYQPSLDTPIQFDASGRRRSSMITTLLDAKTINGDEPAIWESVGTGTDTFANNMSNMAVASGQYQIRQTKVHMPYFSGKSQLVEMTFDGFAYETGVIKRLGYFSSNATAPYDSTFDGWYLESNGVSNSYYIVIYNNGTLVSSIEFTNWDGYSELASYDWDNFTIMFGDFLWLGGSELRIFFKSPSGGAILAHTYRHAGNATGTFTLSPNQPLRYEMRGVTGAGTMRAVCSTVGSEGSLGEAGELRAEFNGSVVNLTTGSDYVLLGVRKSASYHDTPMRIDTIGVGVTNNDGGILILCEGATVSGTLTWSASYRHEVAIGDGSQTVTARGQVIAPLPVVSAGESDRMIANALTWMGMNIDNTAEEYLLVYVPLTTNQNVAGVINLLEY